MRQSDGAESGRLVKLLVVGAGVIGSVYGAQLGAGGSSIAVLQHGLRTADVARDGLVARDRQDGRLVQTRVTVVQDAGADVYDLVLVALRREQLAAAWGALQDLAGQPAVVLFGNNPDGRSAAPIHLGSQVRLGFPGIGGVMLHGVAQYVRIPQQPTALEASADPRLSAVAAALRQREFTVQRVADMDGWLLYHAVFVSCVAQALYRCGADPVRLARDRPTLRLMCRAVTEGFAALRRRGVRGLPRNLAILHTPVLRPLATAYWARTMDSPMGELCFAAHARHAQAEMHSLAQEVLARIGSVPGTTALRLLLGQ